MGKIEKTLELNITHELLILADSFWWYLSSISLKRYWRPSWKFPLLVQPKSYVTGLPLRLEGNPGGGYDVCLISPNILGSNYRAVFMQFKAGVHKDFHTNCKSIFYGTSSSPKPHVEFTFNDNKKKNQHKLLQDLATANAGFPHSVVYCFPRFTTEQEICDNAGRLLQKTSFVSIADIDDKAIQNGVTINDGIAHKFRSDYNIYDVNEVNFFYFLYDKTDQTKKFVSEIISIRVMRAFEALHNKLNELPKIYMDNVAEAFIQYIRFLANYFGLNFYNEIPKISESVYSKHIIFLLNEIRKNNASEQNFESSYGAQHEIFYEILKDLGKYFQLTEASTLDEIHRIPKAHSYFTFELKPEGLKIELNSEVEYEDYIDINYTLI